MVMFEGRLFLVMNCMIFVGTQVMPLNRTLLWYVVSGLRGTHMIKWFIFWAIRLIRCQHWPKTNPFTIFSRCFTMSSRKSWLQVNWVHYDMLMVSQFIVTYLPKSSVLIFKSNLQGHNFQSIKDRELKFQRLVGTYTEHVCT